MAHTTEDFVHQSSETTPLLPSHEAGASPSASPHHRRQQQRKQRQTLFSTLSTDTIPQVHIPKVHNGNVVVLIFCFMVFVISCANGFAFIPLMTIVEDILCERYYHGPGMLPPTRGRCKIPPIQSKMAYLFAAGDVVQAVSGFLAAFPWGVAADKLGRKPVFTIALVGLSCSILWYMFVVWFHRYISLNMIVLSSLFTFIGGGPAVLIGILLSMITDLVPENERATAFTRLHVASLIGTLGSPAMASALMSLVGPWVVLSLAVVCLTLGAIVFLFVPESLPKHKTQSTMHTSANEGSPESSTTTPPSTKSTAQTLKAHIQSTFHQLKSSISILQSSSLIILLFTGALTSPAVLSQDQFMVQFVSQRYDIPLSSTGYIQALNGGMQALVAILLLPLLSHLLLQTSMPKALRAKDEKTRDLTLARLSLSLLCMGLLVLAFTPRLAVFVAGIVVLALGSASTSLVRSLMSLYVDAEHTSRLYSLVAMVEVIGSVYGPPMLAALFDAGMKAGEPWVGLPYVATAGLIVLTLVLLGFVRVPSGPKKPDAEAGEASRVNEAGGPGQAD